MLCDAVWCCVMLCDAVWYRVIQCDAVWCSVMLCDTMWCSVIQCDTVWWWSIACDNVTLCDASQFPNACTQKIYGAWYKKRTRSLKLHVCSKYRIELSRRFNASSKTNFKTKRTARRYHLTNLRAILHCTSFARAGGANSWEHTTFRTLWRSLTRHGSRNVFSRIAVHIVRKERETYQQFTHYIGRFKNCFPGFVLPNSKVILLRCLCALCSCFENNVRMLYFEVSILQLFLTCKQFMPHPWCGPWGQSMRFGESITEFLSVAIGTGHGIQFIGDVPAWTSVVKSMTDWNTSDLRVRMGI